MTTETETAPKPQENRVFEADVAKLLHLMVHSVYSDKDVFLRELISNAADACEKLRFEAISTPALLGDDPKPRILISADEDARLLTIEDNGVGMSRDEMIEALGTIARSGTKAFMERLDAAQAKDGAQLIGQFGVGFYSAFMVADRVDVFSRRAGSDEAAVWSSDGQGAYTVAEADLAEAPARGTRVVLHLMEDAKSYAERWTLERIVKAQSGHVPVPISLVEKPGAEPTQIADGAALWTKPKSEISKEDYAEFYKSLAGAYDDPAMTVHYRAEGRHEYTALAFVPSAQPFDLFDPDRKGRMKLYVRRVFITDEADLLPRWLRFVRGLVDSNDLPLNVSREMIQESPVLAAIRKGLTNRVLGDLEKLAENDKATFETVWDAFGPVIKEGLYEDFERREQLLKLARFKTTTSGENWRTLKDYVAGLRENQTAIYYLAGGKPEQLLSSPHLEGFRARGVEVLLLSDPVDSFWVTSAADFEGKPFKSITQGAAELALIPKLDGDSEPAPETAASVADFIAFAKTTLGDAVADVRTSDRLTESAVCLVAPDFGPDRQLEKILASSGRAGSSAKPILEINPTHGLVVALAAKGADDQAFREDAVSLLFDEAKILDGERPADPQAFSGRLARVLERALR
ncbi:molecular chaperone HtpG [Hansschlegelia plantiphila]|uniref:Chaperone protein HtpG n=1 Tax=Hansschlegelia plantiphila TaxID=374655 RepID=A0A9W6MV80_9HYPH|nr:molecular chaperone HtpG [Hansschlegelia plantiphila]GLK68184.1 chaperone protein HtpG [Hansschlegelia plantiphila]